MADASPHRFGRYELVGLIGRGGMGEVWHGRMEGAAGWKKDVAIKRLLPHLAQDGEFLSRFLDEGRLAASLSHGNIAAIFDMGEVDGEHFVAMEYVDGIDLRDALRLQREKGQPMPVEVAVLVASELCKALEYAHTRNDADGHPLHIVHRDVSPSNVLLSRAGEVKLVDFGIAAARSRAVRTLTGQLRGKLSYMSPEQATGSRVDARSDVFALGAVLYEMLCGQRALDGASEPEILARVQAADFVPLDRVRPSLDAELVAIVHRAMARDPAERFASADAFGVALMRFLMRDTGPVTQRRLAAWVAELVPVRTPASVPVTRRNAFDALLDAQRLPPPDADATRTASGPVPAPQQSWPGAGIGGNAVSGSLPGALSPVAAVPPAAPPRRLVSLSVPIVAILAVIAVAAAFASRPETVALQVSTQPAEARVYVDGVELGTTPLRARIDADAAQVRVALEGYRSESSEVVVVDGSMVWDVDLHALPVPVVFESIPAGATVRLDDADAFVAGNAVPVEPGATFRVRMELDGYAPHDATVTLQPGIDRYTARLEPLPPNEATDSATSAQSPPTGNPAEAIVASTQPDTAEPRETDRPPRARSTDEGADTGSTSPAPTVSAAPPGEVLLWFPEPPMVGALFVDGTAISGHDWQHALQLPPGPHTVEVVNTAYNVVHRAEIVVESGSTTRHMVSWQPR